MSRLKMIDLFSGAGGLSEGLRKAGFFGLYANEIKKNYAATYAINHPDTIIDQRDIRDVGAKGVRQELGLKKGELDLVAGGPPCQGFSINAPVRSACDARNHLFKEFMRFVDEFYPRTVLIENVPGLVSFEGGMTLQAILTTLEHHGYQSDVQILYAPHYGVPQTRWRTIVIGVRDGLDIHSAFPEPTREAPIRVNFTSRFEGRNIVALPSKMKLPRFVSVKDAIDDLPCLKNGEAGDAVKKYRTKPQNDFQRLMRTGSNGVVNHEAARLGRINMERLSHIPAGGNWTNIPVELLPKGMQRARRSDHTKRYGRVDPEGLASTILTKCDPHWGAYFHYEQDRAFTVREAARIQTFSDSYHFSGSRVEQYEQVGNAVPPLLATAIGSSLAGLLGYEIEDLKKGAIMAGTIWEFFGYRVDDESREAQQVVNSSTCPIIGDQCEKRFSDGVVSGVCTIKPMTSEPVICCPIRLYADDYKILKDVAVKAFDESLPLVPGREANTYVKDTGGSCVAVFGKRWGGELRLPQKSGRGGYFVDWVLAKLDSKGDLDEFVAVEVQTIDTTGNYRNGFNALKENRKIEKTTAGLNWENVSKRILPQLIYKGQVLQRESMCRKGLFFVCPEPVLGRIMDRLGGKGGLVKYALQPASITFLAYQHDVEKGLVDAQIVPLKESVAHSTTVYKVQEAFNNVTLPDENVYKNAILKALGKSEDSNG